MDPRARIALLIDADNSSAKKLDLILSELSKLGETSIRRAYGNWTKPGLRPWTEILHANAILPMQQFDYSRGKNASDMAMVVDAMALLYNDHPDAFGIVSSDADFTPLVMHLRAKGAQVYGFGEAKAPEPFQSACTKFLQLDQLADPVEEAATEPATTDGPEAPVVVEAPPTKAVMSGCHVEVEQAGSRRAEGGERARAGRGSARATSRATPAWCGCCATPPRVLPTRTAGRGSARSASTSRTSRRSTRATTGTAR